MSTCTAAEIAEKRRIALEKLRAKKESTLAAQTVTKTFYNTSSNNNKQISSTSSGTTTSTKTTNSFKTALEALKQSSKLQPYPRASTHPYQRPNATPSFSTNHQPPKSSSAGTKVQKLAPVFTNSISCQIYMISSTYFSVNPSGYHAQLIEVFKTIPSKCYDNKTRIWSFALKDYQLLQERVGGMKPEVLLGNIPKKVLDLCAAPVKKIDRSCLASIESKLAKKLMPFQEEGVCFAIAQNGCIMICDEMGLGKTYQALGVADFYRDDWPLLICTTAATRQSWSTHVQELLPSIPVHYIQVLASGDQYFGDAKVLIISYSMLGTHIDLLCEKKFGVLVFDESHQLKNAKSKCSQAADRLARKARRVILLSGTPALSRPLELFTQLQLIDRKFMNFMEFTTRYCDGKQTHFGWDASGQSNLQELNVVLKLKFIIRRTKADVLPDLAMKNRETIVLDPALLWTNDDVKAKLNKFAEDFSASKGKEKEEVLLRFYAHTATVKTRAVCSYLKSVVKENVKFIVFAHHQVMLDAICDCLNKLDVNFIRIDGKTRNDTRVEYIDRFQTKSSCKVAVLSLRACNSGITLTAAEIIIFAELDWNPSTLAQAESRAHRIGQDKQVICRYLMASDTADDIIWYKLKNKQDILNKAGLFCENLQDATSSAAPTISNKIERYFSPDKSRLPMKENTSVKGKAENELTKKPLREEEKTSKFIAELENVEELFEDDDAFNDIII